MNPAPPVTRVRKSGKPRWCNTALSYEHGRERALGIDAAQGVCVARQSRAGGRPAGVLQAERTTKVGQREPLDQGASFGVLVRRLLGFVAGDSAERVLRPEHGEQALAARTQEVGVSAPVRPSDGQRGVVL